ncbi:hypothetical protein [Dokdonella sp.]|uniref:hypothetical protein n=1 Tax=Dokdonella sp. TaxID=2291710 RepID=UPI003528D3F5
MLRKGSIHVRDAHPLADGTYLAITLTNRPPRGVMAWAGTLRAAAADKQAADIAIDDYDQVEKVSFRSWPDVWEYFSGRQYDELLAIVHAEVDKLYPGE